VLSFFIVVSLVIMAQKAEQVEYGQGMLPDPGDSCL
jgi:hypothetical protein